MSYTVMYIYYHDLNYDSNNFSFILFKNIQHKKHLDSYKISSEIELQSLSLFKNKNESKIYCEAKELFDSAYSLSKKKLSSVETYDVMFERC